MGLKGSYLDRRKELYEKLRVLSTWDQVLEVAEERSYADFYPFVGRDYIGDPRYQKVPQVRTTLLVFLSEGKAMMECWTTLFKYLEHMIHLQSDRHPVAGAVKLGIG